MNALALYETMSSLSAQMAAAAAACDWDRLTALEAECAALARRLQSGEQPQRLTEAECARKMALIRRILADDAEVRRHTEAWMKQVHRFLGGGSPQHRLRQAYGLGR